MGRIETIMLYLKPMKDVFLVSLILLSFFMLVTKLSLGMTNADTLSLIVVNKDESELSKALVEKIEGNMQIKLIQKKESKMTRELETADGVLTLENDFVEKMSSNKSVGSFRPGSNAHQAAYLQELILSQVLTLKADQLFEENVDQAELIHNGDDLPSYPLVEIEPIIAGKKVDLSQSEKFPVGILALGLLFSFVTIVPFVEKQSKRLLFYGEKAYFKQTYYLFFCLLLTWSISLTLVILGGNFLMGLIFSISDYLYWLSFLLLIQSIFLLVRKYLSNKWLVILFIPWFILNMTLGGGLWENPYGNHVLQSIFPVALVIEKQWLLILGIILFCHCLFILKSVSQLKK